jgi:fumarate reductase flavoprotein subunit
MAAPRKRRPSNELIILSASAVLGVFAAGYVITEPAAGLLDQAVIASPTPIALTGSFRDGTYLGEGQSRFGSVFVTVAIARSRIAQVWINAVTTSFPSQAIDGLRDQVVARQSAAVDLVSGATASSSAFVQAIQAALRQAQ